MAAGGLDSRRLRFDNFAWPLPDRCGGIGNCWRPECVQAAALMSVCAPRIRYALRVSGMRSASLAGLQLIELQLIEVGRGSGSIVASCPQVI